MINGLTDNKASVPDLVRSLIVFFHGINCMDLIDFAGDAHDFHLNDGMPRHEANRLMIGEMAGLVAITAYLTILFGIALWIYRILPDCVSDFYWRIV